MIEAWDHVTTPAYLAAVDTAAPGLLVGLHVVGSAALGDHRPGSDLDLVGELARVATDTDLAALAAAHAAHPDAETVYVAAGELAGEVGDVADGPWGAEGTLHTGERSFQLNPVTWLQLREHAITVRGDRPRPPVEDAVVRRFCARNLGEYWAPTVDRVDTVLAERPHDVVANRVVLEWVALGPPRLWHTIRTGEVVSKTRAGELAAEHWPDLATPLTDLLAVRRGESVDLTLAHARAAVTLARRVLRTS